MRMENYKVFFRGFQVATNASAKVALVSQWFPGTMDPPPGPEVHASLTDIRQPIPKEMTEEVRRQIIMEVRDQMSAIVKGRSLWIAEYISNGGIAMCREYEILSADISRELGVYLDLAPKQKNQGDKIRVLLWTLQDPNNAAVDKSQKIFVSRRWEDTQPYMYVSQYPIPRSTWVHSFALWSIDKMKGTETRTIRNPCLGFDMPLLKKTLSACQNKILFVRNDSEASGPEEKAVKKKKKKKETLWKERPSAMDPISEGNAALLSRLHFYPVVKTEILSTSALKIAFDRITKGYCGECLDTNSAMYQRIRTYCSRVGSGTKLKEERPRCNEALMALYKSQIEAFNMAYDTEQGQQITQMDHERLVEHAIFSKQSFERQLKNSAIAQRPKNALRKIWEKLYESSSSSEDEPPAPAPAERPQRPPRVQPNEETESDDDDDDVIIVESSGSMVGKVVELHKKYNLFGMLERSVIKTFIDTLYSEWTRFVKTHKRMLDASDDRGFWSLVGQPQNKRLLKNLKAKTKRKKKKEGVEYSEDLWIKYLCQYAGAWGQPWRCDYTFISIRVFQSLDKFSAPLPTKIGWLNDAYRYIQEHPVGGAAAVDPRSERQRQIFDELARNLPGHIPRTEERPEPSPWARPYMKLMLLLPKTMDLYKVMLAITEAPPEDDASEEMLQGREQDQGPPDFERQLKGLRQQFLSMRKKRA